MPDAQQPNQLYCHGSGRFFTKESGADLFENPEASTAHQKRVAAAEGQLASLGFKQIDGSNAWEKNKVQITIQQVMQEGLDNVIQKHGEVVLSLPATP